jgi:hypothetical protein
MTGNNHPRRGGRRGPCVNPTVDEVRRAQARAGWTNAQCAEACCVSEHTWENWVTEGPNHRDMPAGAWKLFRYEVGLLKK